MKKDELLGLEVYYEDNPQPPKPKVDPWAFGDSSEEDDFLNDDDWNDDDWDDDYDLPSEEPCVPVKGRIYKVKGLNLLARLKVIRPLTPTAGILEMDHHGHKFYIDPSSLTRANPTEVEEYLDFGPED